jgi:4-diphosphocytidyl-2C-methyl-D-erythritol kinase
VFRETDRLAVAREPDELAVARDEVRAGRIPHVNDLEEAAVRLLPWVGEALEAARQARAERVIVSGSGPTVIGFFASRADAQRGAESLASAGWPGPPPIVTAPLSG